MASHYNSHYNFRHNFFASETGPPSICDSCDIFHLTIPVYLIIGLFDLWNLDGVCSGTHLLHSFAGEDVEGDDVHLGVAVFARLRS